MKKIYVSGKITDNPDYKKQFARKVMELQDQYIVLSPTMINAELSWKEYMRIDLSMLNVCDCIYMLKGWENSRGAKIEHFYAELHNKEIIYENN